MKQLPLVLGLIAVALFATVLSVGCGGGGGGGNSFTVKGTDYKFDPADITVQSGQKVTVTLQNNGSVAHNWTVLDLDGKDVGTGDVEPRQKKSVEFTATKAGTYTIECTVPGHADAGMKGTLTVR